MSEENTNSWVVTSERSSSGTFSSLNALMCQVGHKRIYSPYERPPFPIKIDKPTFSDVFSAMRWSDFFMFGTLYSTGILASYIVSRPFVGIG